MLVPSSAHADELNGELAVDFIRAQSSNDGPDAGQPVDIGAQDIGMRLRLNGRHGRLSTEIDYHGREPVGGDVENSELRLLYAAYLRYDARPQQLHLQAGRFLAPSAVLLPVDAVSATLRSQGWTVTAFGGRRAILTSRRNVPLDEYLPAAGTSVSWRDSRFQADAAVAFSEDTGIFLKGGSEDDDEIQRQYDAWNGYANAWLRPTEGVSIVGRVSLAERASYVLGPSWRNVELDVQTLDLFNSSALVEWQPHGNLRSSYDVHTQRASVYRSGLIDGAGDPVTITPDSDEPRFTDHRIRAGWRALQRGWLRAEVRLRLRPERQENRYGISIDFDELGVERLELKGRFFYDQIDPEPGKGTRFDQDRTFYSGSLGYRFTDLDLELGASRLERDLPPYSGRTFRGDQPSEPTSADDLGLFAIETESIAFTRLFYARGLQFGGLDLEINLEDRAEARIFVQLGTRWEYANGATDEGEMQER